MRFYIATLTVLLAVIPTLAIPPEEDPAYCAYWIEQMASIAMWEEMRLNDVPRIAREENQYAAVDFDIELRERIRAIIRRNAGDP